MKLTNPFRRSDPKPDVVADAEGTVFSVNAPASLPLPFTAVPSADALVDDAETRAGRLTAGGGADEFCGDVFDTHYDRWRLESSRSAAFLAGEQRRVDRVLVDDAHHRAGRALVRADAAQAVATRHGAAADHLWDEVFGQR